MATEGSQPRGLSAEEIRRWSDLFVLLSLNRFIPLFEDLGLPAAVLSRPESVVNCVRVSLNDEDLPSTDVAEAIRRIDRAFDRIADAYGSDVAAALRTWCLRAVEQIQKPTRITWADMFRRLCGIPDSGLVTAGLTSDARRRVCRCALEQFEPAILAQERSRIHTARKDSPTAWEIGLNERVQRAAGDVHQRLNAVDISADLAALLIRNRRIEKAKECLNTELSPSERERVDSWMMQMQTLN